MVAPLLKQVFSPRTGACACLDQEGLGVTVYEARVVEAFSLVRQAPGARAGITGGSIGGEGADRFDAGDGAWLRAGDIGLIDSTLTPLSPTAPRASSSPAVCGLLFVGGAARSGFGWSNGYG